MEGESVLWLGEWSSGGRRPGGMLGVVFKGLEGLEEFCRLLGAVAGLTAEQLIVFLEALRGKGDVGGGLERFRIL